MLQKLFTLPSLIPSGELRMKSGGAMASTRPIASFLSTGSRSR